MPDARRTAHLQEARLACPVCLGVTLRKVVVETGGRGQVVLDHCARCGGIWFERDEVVRLAACAREALHAQVGQHAPVAATPCHKCRAPLARDAERCEACGRRNVLQCPACRQVMRRIAHDGLVLDACDGCHGVWFDHAELEHVWTAQREQATERWRARRGRRGAQVLEDGGGALVEAIVWSPDLLWYGGHAVGHVAGAGLELAGHAVAGAGQAIASGAAAEAATAAVEIAGDAASGVFEAIVEIIAGIFS